MPTCDQCGEKIEFRYMDGRPTPIHQNGGWCSGTKPNKAPRNRGWFRTPEAFTDPNALCPVCGASVFYYQNSFGSRVFFDDLGWPWPKHPCTDNPIAQSAKVKRLKKRKARKGASAFAANIYELANANECDGFIEAKFRSLTNMLIVRTFHFPVANLEAAGWTLDDLRAAPSFVIRKGIGQTVLEFISVRTKQVGRLVVSHTANP
ncbi:hypothetical protein SAMN04488060_0962 [Qipengyuania nanhaisediminis]|uniref:Uncharacterized protein n=1 Tax=Qipengyuania nanhaisediminis TaxID=604088 RepID=A0A1I5LEA1_9SPHN|nr:hypothetical protein SAMN04488060_0962 [Qipengyuania nanhaisediminis]